MKRWNWLLQKKSSDRIQILDYAYLIEAELGITVAEGQIRYPAENVLVHVAFDDAARQDVYRAIAQVRQIRQFSSHSSSSSSARPDGDF
ncbi:MAG: Dna2/Cas4 domain-containing protein [Elainellaceae cyanobacterium]